ncbi:phosphomannomutase/phosphoglucomutase [Balneolaceae bacterium ANBcel3]|nr:phosphomannomutase/phosphoglucomutase [Balneolaceae bacterium ANBcel3]
MDVSAFKAYDVRGVYPLQINAQFMYLTGKAYATIFQPKKVVIGYDARLSSEELAEALEAGLSDSGVDVVNIGLCGSEMVYYATGRHKTDGGIMITASHNPKEYNGCKMVMDGARPVGPDTGLNEIKKLVASEGPFKHIDGKKSERNGTITKEDISEEFLTYMLDMLKGKVDPNLKVVVNSGNGAAGPVIKKLAKKLPCTIYPIFDQPDGNFPNGVPNPLLPERRKETSHEVVEKKADLGVAFDGDFDRCFFFDENGRFIEGYYLVGLLARQILTKYPGAKIVHDPRLTWHTIEVVQSSGGQPVMSKTGHAYIKTKMREQDAVYAGEMSAHHYFKDFWYCDSGLLPFLLVLELLSENNDPLSAYVDEAFRNYPVSGELNFKLKVDPISLVRSLAEHYDDHGGEISFPDGLNVEFDQWRASLRVSNTEPLLRLNVESRGDYKLVEEKKDEMIALIRRLDPDVQPYG